MLIIAWNRMMAANQFKLKSIKASESDLQAQIIAYLRFEQNRGRVVWFCRNNSGGMFDKTKRFLWFYRLFLRQHEPISKGKSDLDGQLLGGRYFALEVKADGEKASSEQLAFLQAVRDGGGIAAVVRSYSDAQSVLFEKLDKSILR